MHVVKRGSAFLLFAAVLSTVPAAIVSAQQCDYRIVTAWWTENPDPSLINLHFIAAVDGAPEGVDAQHPIVYDMDLNVRYNNNPVILGQDLALSKWATPNLCTGSCQSVVCRHEEWVYKGVVIPQDSRCLKNAQNQCGCPTLGTPVVHEKPVPKPPGPVTIEIELVALSLQSCQPIKPENDRYQIPYPQQGPQPVPGLPRAAVTVLALLLVSLGSVALRRWRGQAA
jgi:hypothetical protein